MQKIADIVANGGEYIFKMTPNEVMENPYINSMQYQRQVLYKPLIRCKDCKHWAGCEDYDCEIHSGAFGANDYCSYGERKGGDDE